MKILPLKSPFPVILNRASTERANPDWIQSQLENPRSEFIPFYRGDPFIINGDAGFLTMAARSEFSQDANFVFLGLDKKNQALFALDATSSAPNAETAPFHEVGSYVNMRNIAGDLGPKTIAILGQARWLLEWHSRNYYCANCGQASALAEGGAKRHCDNCNTDHFPRTEPVAIILIEDGDQCLLGRGPHFPPGFLSCLAGFVEASETAEECAIREVYEEAGIIIDDVRYQFSQPWPFPASLMMGFFARAKSRDLNLDTNEIEEARWISRQDIQTMLAGDKSSGIFLPPRFTIARRLLEKWAG